MRAQQRLHRGSEHCEFFIVYQIWACLNTSWHINVTQYRHACALCNIWLLLNMGVKLIQINVCWINILALLIFITDWTSQCEQLGGREGGKLVSTKYFNIRRWEESRYLIATTNIVISRYYIKDEVGFYVVPLCFICYSVNQKWRS